MLTRLSLATTALFVLVTACAPASQGPATTPVAHTTTSPSHEPSPLPSPTPSPSAALLKVTSAAFHAGEIGFGYASASAAAAGGVPPYSWSITGGALPGGLSMSSAGFVTGTPSSLGSFLFTVQVDDSGGNSATIDTSIAVVRRLVVSPSCPINFPCMVEAGCLSACGVFGNQSGGVGPFTYKVLAGAIPRGMGLNGFSLTRAFPAPVPATGTTDWVFTVRVVDGIGATAQATAKFHVFPHIAFTESTATCVVSGTSCSATIAYTLGTPGLSKAQVKTTPGSLPNGWSAVAQGLTVTVTVTCTVKGLINSTLTVIVVDGSICASGAGAYCSSGPATVKISMSC